MLLFQENPLGCFYQLFQVLPLLFIDHFWLYFSRLLFHVTSISLWFFRSVKGCTRSELYPNCSVAFFCLLGLSSLVILLSYCVCYRFERAFLTIMCLLPYIPSSHFGACTASSYFCQGFSGSQGFQLRFETQTWPIYLFESQCSKKHIVINNFT